MSSNIGILVGLLVVFAVVAIVFVVLYATKSTPKNECPKYQQPHFPMSYPAEESQRTFKKGEKHSCNVTIADGLPSPEEYTTRSHLPTGLTLNASTGAIEGTGTESNTKDVVVVFGSCLGGHAYYNTVEILLM